MIGRITLTKRLTSLQKVMGYYSFLLAKFVGELYSYNAA